MFHSRTNDHSASLAALVGMYDIVVRIIGGTDPQSESQLLVPLGVVDIVHDLRLRLHHVIQTTYEDNR